MSQTGAKYAASTNAGYRQILSFYYPGTTLVPKYGKGAPENLDPDIPEGEKMVSMTGKYVEVNTAKPAGLNIWNSTNKGLSLLVVPKGETLYVVEDKMTGWVIAKKDGIQGHVDKQYLVEVDDITQDELELEPPVIEQPSINFEKYEAKIVTTYDAGLSLWNNTNKNLRLVRVKKGEIVTVVDEVNAQWGIAEYKGTRGYIDRRYLQKIKEIITYKRNGLNLTIECKTEDQVNSIVRKIDELNK